MRILLTLALLCAQSTTTMAAAVSLTWDECTEEAARNNPEIRGALNSYSSSQSAIGSAKAGYFPQVSASTGYDYASPATDHDTYSVGVSATQNVFSGFQDQARVEQAEANSQSSEAALKIVRARISNELAAAYINLLIAQRSIVITEEIIKRRVENHKMVDLRYRGGQENKGSVLLAKANVNQAHYENLQAKNSIQVSAAQLAKVLGRDDTLEIRVADDFPNITPPENLNLKKLAATTPEYQQTISQAQSAHSQLQIAKSGYYPTLSLNASSTNSETEWMPEKNQWTVGATLSFPIFSGFRDYYSTKSAKDNYEAAEHTRHNMSLQSLFRLRQTLTGFKEALVKLNVDESFLLAAKTRAEIARRKYQNGLLTFDNWDVIENDLIDRQKKYLESQMKRMQAQAAWDQAQGKGVLP